MKGLKVICKSCCKIRLPIKASYLVFNLKNICFQQFKHCTKIEQQQQIPTKKTTNVTLDITSCLTWSPFA